MAGPRPPYYPLALLCIYYTLVLCIHLPCACASSFAFNFSTTEKSPCGTDLECRGDAFFANRMIELTKNDITRPSNDSKGRVWYASPVRLWDAGTNELASFATTFNFKITPVSSYITGDGMAFFLAPYSADVLNTTAVGGGNFGLLSDSDSFNATGNSSVVAVEFDTFHNYWDDSSQHVGIDVNSIRSKAWTNTSVLGKKAINLASDVMMIARINYDNRTKLLAVDLGINGSSYRVSHTVDLKSVLPEKVAIGFSAATGSAAELHRKRRRQTQLNIGGTSGSESDQDGEAVLLQRGVAGPRRYHYRELAAATGDFNDENKLGRGGFGSVYLGNIVQGDSDIKQVAVKKFSSETSSQGRKEFEAEVKIISRLRHRNLVQLLGWCDSTKGLLLVYELVPEGSLDKHIHNNSTLLSWSERYKIILGLGSALSYLHRDWDQCVVHGDIKPSNIMLDSSYNTKLGDFGLARLADHGTGPQTTATVLGTAGYIDPDFVNTRRRRTESDVYSFGIVLLEIVSGKPPVFQEPPFVLLKWVWSLHSQGAILDAADARLRGDEADEQQMERALVVGLWCTHHDPAQRPSIVEAMHVLQSQDAKLPVLPRHMYMLTAMPSVISMGESGVSDSSFSSGVRSSATTVTRRSSESFPN
ncbi:hypothetical protein PR202_ga16092 [Eleusine coracana subsp. coracana]|uniref:non-specific serine/threonine protein kinase n=1 Tax=Eleusine coracana subsp. coracana TaxID=191504 RepID=A0AAV5CLX2_ELECO|nr:hypothetical protein PR202_ga16092 [Eleusine coracana subsp. coracana]